MENLLIILLLSVTSAIAVQHYRFCTPESISHSDISSMTKGDSQIECIPVTDSADCAIKINEGTADFGIFNAEELLLAYQFYPESLIPITQLKHKDKILDDYEFRTVAVVPESLNFNEGIEALKNGGLCHPGFSESQTWSDYILKFFEKTAYTNSYQCNKEVSVGENEAINIKAFFGKACRPGNWVNDPSHNEELRKKYPELCELCDDIDKCRYKNEENHGHMGALDCLISNQGKVAYVAHHYVQQYFGINTKDGVPSVKVPGYQFLCPNGGLQPLTATNPCAWIQQPWSTIVARKDQADAVLTNLKNWVQDSLSRSQSWTSALINVLQKDGKIVYFQDQPTLKSYLINGRVVNLPNTSCGNKIRWCTINEAETTKCKWIIKESQLLGIEPEFSCHLKESTFDCLSNISANQADIITIDSNDGYIARRIYNLTTVLYTDTDKEMNSVVVAVVRYDSPSVRTFEDIDNKRVCFPKYGGLAWLSFINTLRNKNIIKDTNNYPKAIADLLIGACTPGINDIRYSQIDDWDIIQELCSACPLERSNNTCTAHITNRYYGDDGALKCLSGPGDIAFIEPKNLRDKAIDHGDFRVLCKNGSLAEYSGFDIDDNCALSVTINSEVVGRKNNDKIDALNTILALLKLENHPYSRRAIKIYESFRGNSDLLFKDSTVGLEPIDSEFKSIIAYKELFRIVDSTSGGIHCITSNSIVIFISTIVFIICYLPKSIS